VLVEFAPSCRAVVFEDRFEVVSVEQFSQRYLDEPGKRDMDLRQGVLALYDELVRQDDAYSVEFRTFRGVVVFPPCHDGALLPRISPGLDQTKAVTLLHTSPGWLYHVSDNLPFSVA